MKNNPVVSVIIPVKDISYYIIFENLPGLEKQIYKNFEVIILPNEHTQYDLELLKKYKWLRIIPTGKITRPALKRNRGVEEAKGEIIAFIDDDAFPTKDWLKKAVELFVKKHVEAVCGPGVVPPHSNRWEKIFDYVLRSWIGSGGYAYRFFPQPSRYVDDYPSMNFLIKKDVFQALGGFNNDFWPGEDSKLTEDLVYRRQGKILYHPDVLIYHHRRNTLAGYLKQHQSYGYHRGAFFAHGDTNSRRISYVIPTLFLMYLITIILLALANIFWPVHNLIIQLYLIPLYLYGLATLILFVSTLISTKDIIMAFGTVFVLVLTHFHYGILFVQGYIKGLTQKNKIYD